MDCIPCEINFEIIKKPKQPLTEMALSEVDGNLRIISNQQTIFDENDICLVEFASKVSSWLESMYPREPFIYQSMDYEDEFIVKVEVCDECVLFDSPWVADGIIVPVLINRHEFVGAIKRFLEKLEEEIPNVHSVFDCGAKKQK